ncbi:MAG: nitroreductase family protein [Bacilli bacterium]|nr:nitroreductase family protein [Bacilli bacterium]
MEFLKLAEQRYSERAFDKAHPIEEEKLSKILEAGRLAPTACNLQPQKVYVFKTDDSLWKAAKLTHTYDAPIVLLVCYDLNTVWKNSREEGYNAGEQDASIVATSMMFEAEDLGIHSIWLRGFNSKLVSEAFELPENIKPVMMLAIGYPTKTSEPSPRHSDRKPLTDTVEER